MLIIAMVFLISLFYQMLSELTLLRVILYLCLVPMFFVPMDLYVQM